MFNVLILCLILIISLITDIKKRKILNIVTLPAILLGFVFYTVTLGWEGFLFSGKGFLVGLGVLLIPYLLGGMGAGDVKLMAAIGALTGATFTFYAFIYTGLVGGIIAVILIIKSRGLLNSIKSGFFAIKSVFFRMFLLRGSLGEMVIHNNKPTESKIVFPYAIAITLGTLAAYVFGGGFT